VKACVRLWQYLPKFLLDWEVFKEKVVEKFKTQILCSVTIFRLWDNMEGNGRAR